MVDASLEVLTGEGGVGFRRPYVRQIGFGVPYFFGYAVFVFRLFSQLLLLTHAARCQVANIMTIITIKFSVRQGRNVCSVPSSLLVLTG